MRRLVLSIVGSPWSPRSQSHKGSPSILRGDGDAHLRHQGELLRQKMSFQDSRVSLELEFSRMSVLFQVQPPWPPRWASIAQLKGGLPWLQGEPLQFQGEITWLNVGPLMSQDEHLWLLNETLLPNMSLPVYRMNLQVESPKRGYEPQQLQDEPPQRQMSLICSKMSLPQLKMGLQLLQVSLQDSCFSLQNGSKIGLKDTFFQSCRCTLYSI